MTFEVLLAGIQEGILPWAIAALPSYPRFLLMKDTELSYLDTSAEGHLDSTLYHKTSAQEIRGQAHCGRKMHRRNRMQIRGHLCNVEFVSRVHGNKYNTAASCWSPSMQARIPP